MANLVALPTELILRVFSLLDGRQIARCSAVSHNSVRSGPVLILCVLKVCAYFKSAIENSTAMQYAIKLDMYGYKEAPVYSRSPVNVAARLDKLDRLNTAWNDLDWDQSIVKFPTSPFSIISDGILVNVALDVVTCVQLPSPLRDVPLRMWTLENPVDIDDIDGIAVDASQDLLVIFYQ
jgi:hypothetical protein